MRFTSGLCLVVNALYLRWGSYKGSFFCRKRICPSSTTVLLFSLLLLLVSPISPACSFTQRSGLYFSCILLAESKTENKMAQEQGEAEDNCIKDLDQGRNSASDDVCGSSFQAVLDFCNQVSKLLLIYNLIYL